MPEEVAKRWGLQKSIAYFPQKDQISVNGVGGKGHIVGVIPKIYITIGMRTEACVVGICDTGKFDILLGNDVTSKLQINIDVN